MDKIKVNKTGYLKGSKTRDNDVNVIPSNNITTENMAFPIFANGKLLMPDTGDYKFDTNYVVETPALNKGGQMKKGKLKPKKMQAGGTTPPANQYASLGLDNSKDTTATLGAAGEAVSLLSPKAQYTSTEAPTLGLGDVAAGAKAGMAFGPIGAGVGAGLGLAKDIYDYQQDHKQFLQNVTNSRNENKRMYDATHNPYGSRGYMQANPNKTSYSLYEGGSVGESPEMRNLSTVIANDQTSHSVSLSKQHGGEIPSDLQELFDRAMEESGGDEDKAEKLVMAHEKNPDMKHNKPKLKKKSA